MLMNKILKKAKEAKEAFLLLKLDTIKTFDFLGWSFLTKLFERIGIGPNFIQMVEATCDSAAVSILIQGRLSTPIPLKRSIHQGCPLSPLLYLIVANALSSLITEAVDQGRIRGVSIVETEDQYTHGQFVDDTSMIIEAKVLYVEATFEIFRCMGNASGLYIKETKVKAIFISHHPMLEDINALAFPWETKANLSKFLGFFIGEDIFSNRMVQHLAENLEKILEKARLSPHSLVVRVKVANQFVNCVLGYMTMLYIDYRIGNSA